MCLVHARQQLVAHAEHGADRKHARAMLSTASSVRTLLCQRSNQTLFQMTLMIKSQFQISKVSRSRNLKFSSRPDGAAHELVARDLAVQDLDDARHALGQLFVVRHHQQRLALAHDLGEQVEHVVRRARVEVARRLVGDQQRRIVRQRAGNRGALLLAARDRAGQLVHLIGQPDDFQQVLGSLAPLLGRVLVGARSIGRMTFCSRLSAGSI